MILNILLFLVTILMGVIAFFLKRLVSSFDLMENRLKCLENDKIERDAERKWASAIQKGSFILAFLILFTFPSCKVKTQKEYIRDSIFINRVQLVKDSIFVYKNDSVVIRMAGDTLFYDRWHTITRDRELIKTDTLYRDKILVQNSEIIKEVNKLYLWQKILMGLGVVGLLYLGLKIRKVL